MATIIEADIPESTYSETRFAAQLMQHYALCSVEEKALLIHIIKNPTLIKIIKQRHKQVVGSMLDLDPVVKTFQMSYNIHRVEVLMLQDLLQFFNQVAEDLKQEFPGLTVIEE